VHFGLTNPSHSVTPSSLSWSKFNLGATDLNLSVTSSCSNRLRFYISVPQSRSTRSHWQWLDIYSHGLKIWKFLQMLCPRLSSSADSRSPDRLLVASVLLLLVFATVNRNLHRRCRRSEFIAKLGYELIPLCLPHSDSEHKDQCLYSFHVLRQLYPLETPLDQIWCKNLGLGFRRTHLGPTDIRISVSPIWLRP
jgi:hypothetical protein